MTLYSRIVLPLLAVIVACTACEKDDPSPGYQEWNYLAKYRYTTVDWVPDPAARDSMCQHTSHCPTWDPIKILPRKLLKESEQTITVRIKDGTITVFIRDEPPFFRSGSKFRLNIETGSIGLMNNPDPRNRGGILPRANGKITTESFQLTYEEEMNQWPPYGTLEKFTIQGTRVY